MKTLILAIVFILAGFSACAYEYTTVNKVGSFTFTDVYNSNTNTTTSLTTQRIGSFDFTNGFDNKGNSYNSTGQQIGNSYYKWEY